MASNMQMRQRMSRIFAGAFTITIFIVLFKKVNLSQFEISAFYYLPAVIIFLSTLAAYILRAYTYRILLQQKKVLPVGILFNITGVYNFVSSLFPFGIGHLTYPYYIQKYTYISLSHSLNSLFVYNSVRVLLLLILMAISVVEGIQVHQFYVEFGKNKGAIFIFLVLIFVSVLIGFILRVGGSGNGENRDNLFSRTIAGLRAFIQYDLKMLPPVTILAIFVIFFNTVNIYFSYQTFGIKLSIFPVIFLLSLNNLSTLLPIHTLSSIGSFELVNTLGMVLLGFDSNQAIQISFAVHFLGLASQSILAVACYYALRKFYCPEISFQENNR